VTTLHTTAPRTAAQPSSQPAPVTDRVGDLDSSLPDSPTATAWQHLRWAVRATLMLGVAASVAANILHALDNPISQAIAAWPPLALLLTVELISRVPVYRRGLAGIRLGATAAIAGIAAWVSYWHMAGVTARYGETGASAYLLPLSVDGLVVVASVSLVEISARMQANINPPSSTPAWTRAATRPPMPSIGVHQVSQAPADAETPKRVAPDPESQITTTRLAPATAAPSTARNAADEHDIMIAALDEVDESSIPGTSACPQTRGDRSLSATTGNPTAVAVAYWRRRDPNMHPDDIAARIGRSSRQVRRYLQATDPPAGMHTDD
jgi:hypothetical protein